MRTSLFCIPLFAVFAFACTEGAKLPFRDTTEDVDGGTFTSDGGTTTPDGGTSPACTADGTQNGLESDIDCGHACGNATCADTKKCLRYDDCTSKICDNNVCQAAKSQAGPTCSDTIRNGNETDVDCGGSCTSKCGLNLSCTTDGDCATNYCSGNRCGTRPTPATCSDNVQNGSESDIDCGASCSTRCAFNKKCVLSADCQSGICAGGLCGTSNTPTPVCNRNGMRDGNESDIDCGGDACGPCPDGKRCLATLDCSSGRCNNGFCEATSSNPQPSCSNQRRDGTESDVDCGGSCTSKCGDGLACVFVVDCLNGVCNNGRCASSTGTTPPPPCNKNGAKDGNESDVDCGGDACGPCGKDKQCLKYLDCQSRICDAVHGSKCIGDAITPTAPATDPLVASGTFLVTAQASIPAGCGEIRIDWTAEKPCTMLQIKQGANGQVGTAWKLLPAPNMQTSGNFTLNGITGPIGFSFRVQCHSDPWDGENGESATGTIQVPYCAPSGGATYTNGMAPGGARYSGTADCASKVGNNGTCAPVESSPYGLYFALEPRAATPGSVDITARLPRGSQMTNNGQSRAILVPIVDLCDPNIAGVNGLNGFVEYNACKSGAGCTSTYAQLRLPLDGGIVYGFSSDGGLATVSKAQLECWRYGYPE